MQCLGKEDCVVTVLVLPEKRVYRAEMLIVPKEADTGTPCTCSCRRGTHIGYPGCITLEIRG